jgi:hypothetical protein
MEMISRRGVFRILGLATLGLVATPTLLTVSRAEFIAIPAQTPETGTERRQERRTTRTDQLATWKAEKGTDGAA